MAGEIAVHYRDFDWEPGRGPGIRRKMLRGDRDIEGQWYEAGCYVYTPPEAVPDVYTDAGATLLLRMPPPAVMVEDLRVEAAVRPEKSI